ncbi:NUDIX hydrolase domain-like protein [Dendryphion nanum]|uniref:NUDIX hydrolase domain-like protein n=1 Tax=Dendryphion nanum TaxID=256645 RepID=A0A9P9D8F7_9PLEO|nr:NUDIX hydrolase domain-like protein [Dendryphion nanum]
MAQSIFNQRQLPSTHFLESSGAILFDISRPQKRICLVHYLKAQQWLLAKGRRNCNESRLSAALREVTEETGYKCRAFPVTMATRATGLDEVADVRDEARVYEGLVEPFMVTLREGSGVGVKFIWWFVAVLDEGGEEWRGEGEKGFEACFFEVEDAVEKLFFESDREVLKRAVELVDATLKSRGHCQ